MSFKLLRMHLKAKWTDDVRKSTYLINDKVKKLQKEVDFPIKLQDLGNTKENFQNNIEKFN